MLPSADKLYGVADFIFQLDLAPAHTDKGTKSWFNDHGVTVLDWPANSPDLNPIENLWGIVKRKMRYTRPNNADDLKAAIKNNCIKLSVDCIECSCGSVVEHCVSSAKCCGFNSQGTHILTKNVEPECTVSRFG